MSDPQRNFLRLPNPSIVPKALQAPPPSLGYALPWQRPGLMQVLASGEPRATYNFLFPGLQAMRPPLTGTLLQPPSPAPPSPIPPPPVKAGSLPRSLDPEKSLFPIGRSKGRTDEEKAREDRKRLEQQWVKVVDKARLRVEILKIP